MILHHSDTPDSREVGDKGFNVCFGLRVGRVTVTENASAAKLR
jgi:hypothetical protein